MSRVAIVTDSTAYIPPKMLRGLPINIVPLQLVWGEETFRDGVDIRPEDFYSRLQGASVMPSTSQPSPGVFRDLYAKLLEQDYEILSVHISSKLSGTIDSALQARDMLPGAKIEVVDSATSAMALGFPVLLAARAATNGATLKDCKTLAEKGIRNSGAMFVVDTLEFLHRGGRIGGAAALVGTAFKIKPILEVQDGKIEPVEKVRTLSKAIDRLLELLQSRVDHRTPLRIAALHANSPEQAQLLLERACDCFHVTDISEAVVSEVSPVIGTHVGPGTLALTYVAGV